MNQAVDGLVAAVQDYAEGQLALQEERILDFLRDPVPLRVQVPFGQHVAVGRHVLVRVAARDKRVNSDKEAVLLAVA